MAAVSVRNSTPADLERMLEIYAQARSFMKAHGNPTQWVTYPEPELLLQDMSLGRSYVLEKEGRICGTFVFTTEPEESYAGLEGEWLKDGPYGVIHRIAGDGSVRGLVERAVSFAFEKVDSIKIDTHPDNTVMQNCLEQQGFTRCGSIYIVDDLSDHSPRIAYQKLRPDTL